ncbi:MAG: T9SS type A sorting domain-containing protein [Crocinitomicaceae bacterium]|nr:T9SS type A sorting domain-containing protein [Crocinitomicaceae bacterium]
MKKILFYSAFLITSTSVAQSTASEITGQPNNAQLSDQTKTYTSCGYLQEGNALENGRISQTSWPLVCADDFIVPDGECWSINNVLTPFMTSGFTGTDNIIITFYANGTGAPGTVAGSFTATPSDFTTTNIGTAYGLTVYSFDINMSTPVELCGGPGGTTYWISAQADNVSGATYYWEFTTLPTYGSNALAAPNTSGPWTSYGADNFVFTINYGEINDITLTECEGFSITVGATTYTTSVVVSETLTSVLTGCDSIVNLDLTILPAPDNGVTQTGVTLEADDATATYQWLDCNDSYAIMSGETNQTFTFPTNGSFAVEVTSGGCVDTSACFLIDYSGLNENNNALISAYPNPASETLFIAGINQLSEISLITITSVSGQIVYSTDKVTGQFNIDYLASGVYAVNISHSTGVETIRFVKE